MRIIHNHTQIDDDWRTSTWTVSTDDGQHTQTGPVLDTVLIKLIQDLEQDRATHPIRAGAAVGENVWLTPVPESAKAWLVWSGGRQVGVLRYVGPGHWQASREPGEQPVHGTSRDRTAVAAVEVWGKPKPVGPWAQGGGAG